MQAQTGQSAHGLLMLVQIAMKDIRTCESTCRNADGYTGML